MIFYIVLKQNSWNCFGIESYYLCMFLLDSYFLMQLQYILNSPVIKCTCLHHFIYLDSEDYLIINHCFLFHYFGIHDQNPIKLSFFQLKFYSFIQEMV